MKIKKNDYFKFRYNDEYIKSKPNSDLYHCFDGRLIVKEYHDGKLWLVDTYWMTDNRKFTLSEALEQGVLELVCNLDEVETISEYEIKYYDNNDVFDLSHQKGCYKRFAKKKNAVRSASKMTTEIKDLIAYNEREIVSIQRNLEILNVKLKQIESGDTSVHF